MISKVKRILEHYHAKRVLVAVSGGVDSMVLCYLVQQIIPSSDIGVVTIDHGLRQESVTETKFVEAYCHKQGLKFFTTKWHHPEGDVGMEAAARKFRYDFFDETMQQAGFDTLLTAHHANDLSENILMKLIRSGNVYEVTSLKRQRDFSVGQLLRPLLDFSKAELIEFARNHGIKYFEDATNFEDITMRNRLRNDIFPQLQKENGQLLNHFGLFDRQLTALIELAQNKFNSIESKMKLTNDQNDLRGELVPVLELNRKQQTLFWGSLFTRRIPELSISNKQIKQIIDISQGNKPNGSLNLENGWKFLRSYNDFEICKQQTAEKLNLLVKLNHQYQIGSKIFTLSESSPTDATFSVATMPRQIVLRTRQDGDRLAISPLQHQKLSKRLINQKIPAARRDDLPILLFDDQIVWVEKIYNIGDYLPKGNKFFKINFNEVKK
ncbi:tRNA lysidine(34) synthetase TilS [Companilactobacillus furfuricola]|uniref:tRNA lysidine(34) synthetase TilS n=1 Tax=Companilactobacillus furfuricola TaxID=1462575 RepID=UPI001FE4974A|nr:tRNA lysidine(34) synthetase TilS [Companilactobacillus furfuricola]